LPLLCVAVQHKLPIIADEIYGDLVFTGSKFHPMASLSTNVPILQAGGIAKEFIVPGCVPLSGWPRACCIVCTAVMQAWLTALHPACLLARRHTNLPAAGAWAGCACTTGTVRWRRCGVACTRW